MIFLVIDTTVISVVVAIIAVVADTLEVPVRTLWATCAYPSITPTGEPKAIARQSVLVRRVVRGSRLCDSFLG